MRKLFVCSLAAMAMSAISVGQVAGPVVAIKEFYDTNANGVPDPDEPPIYGMTINVRFSFSVFPGSYVYEQGTTDASGVVILDQPIGSDHFDAWETSPLSTGWHQSSPLNGASNVTKTAVANDGRWSGYFNPGSDVTELYFGNVEVGPGGGRGIGYWCNKVGQADLESGNLQGYLQVLRDLSLRNEYGTNFDPYDYPQLRLWLRGAKADNICYMTSSQLASMVLGVRDGYFSPLALVYAPGAYFANQGGFVTEAGLESETNYFLSLYGLNLGKSDPVVRDHLAVLLSALAGVNDNKSYVQLPASSPVYYP